MTKIDIIGDGAVYIIDEAADNYICIGNLNLVDSENLQSQLMLEQILKNADSVTLHSANETYERGSTEFKDILTRCTISFENEGILKSAYDEDNTLVTFNYKDTIQTGMVIGDTSEVTPLSISKIELSKDGIFYIFQSGTNLGILPIGTSHIEGLFDK